MADSKYLDIFQDPNFTKERQNNLMAGSVSYTPWELAQSNMELAYRTGVTRLGMDWVKMKALDFATGSPTYSPEEFKSIGIDVPEEMTATEAMYRRDLQDQTYLNSLKQKNMSGGFGETALPFMGSFLGATAVDLPFFTGAGALARAGVAGAGALMNAAGAGGVAQGLASATSGFWGGLASEVAIDGIAAAVIENNVQEKVYEQFGLEFSDEDKRNNILFSAIGSALFYGAGKAWDGAIKKNAAEAMSEGKVPADTPLAIRDAEMYNGVGREADQIPYSAPEYKHTGKVYAVHNAPDRDFNPKTQDTFGTDFGSGVVATTSRDIGFNKSASPVTGQKGQLLELDLSEVNLLNLDVEMHPMVKAKLVEALQGIDPTLSKAVQEVDGPGREVVESLTKLGRDRGNDEIVEAMNKVASDLGYDGYQFTHRDTSGTTHGNGDFGVHVFDPEKFTLGSVEDMNYRDLEMNEPFYEASREADAEYYNSIESQMLFDEVEFREIDGYLPYIESSPDVNKISELSEMLEENYNLVQSTIDEIDDMSFTISIREPWQDSFRMNQSTPVEGTDLNLYASDTSMTLLDSDGMTKYSIYRNGSVSFYTQDISDLPTATELFDIAKSNGVDLSIVTTDVKDKFIDNVESSIQAHARAMKKLNLEKEVVEGLEANKELTARLFDDLGVDTESIEILEARAELGKRQKELQKAGNEEGGGFKATNSIKREGSFSEPKDGSYFENKEPLYTTNEGIDIHQSTGHNAKTGRISAVQDGSIVGKVAWNTRGITSLFTSPGTPNSLASRMLETSVDLGAKPTVSGTISNRAARMANIMRKRHLRNIQRELLNNERELLKIHQEWSPELVSEVTKASIFCNMR